MSAPTRRRAPSAASSIRPSDSNASNTARPPSSASIRPSSSAAIRPSSSASSVRPSSSAGSVRRTTTSVSRPASRATQRPPSRFAPRPQTRQSSRLAGLYQDLVSQLTYLTADADQDEFDATVEYVSRSLDQTARPAVSVDLPSIQQQLRGHAKKARINSEDTLGSAIDHVSREVDKLASQESDLDAEIHTDRLPSHIQFLLALSTPPGRASLDFAEEYLDHVKNPNRPPPGLTWAEILAEEPFTGQHWEGVYGLPPGSVVNEDDNGDDDSDDSVLSLSLLDDDYDDMAPLSYDTDTMSEERSSVSTPPSVDSGLDTYMKQWSKEIDAHSHRHEVEQLQTRQYWRNEWRIDASTTRPFNIGDASSFGPAFRRLGDPANISQNLRYINEHDAVREVLLGLQGRRNLMISWQNTGDHALSYMPDPKAPALLHLTPLSQTSLLASFSHIATTVEHLRRFTAQMFTASSKSYDLSTSSSQNVLFSHTNSRRITRTLEAFSEALDTQVRAFGSWCASEEEKLCKAQAGVGGTLVASLLNLEKRLSDRFADAFDVLLQIVRYIAQRATRSVEPLAAVWTFADLPRRAHPAGITAHLLDSLLQNVQDCTTMGKHTTAQMIVQVFQDTMAPLWTMIYRWLKEGIPIRDIVLGAPSESAQYLQLEEEFFIEDNELVLLDPDFWADCFVLRTSEAEEARASSVPHFLVHVAPHILAAGKAIGLLRMLGVPDGVEQEEETQRQLWLHDWKRFGELLEESESGCEPETEKRSSSLVDFSRLLYDELLPSCQRAGQMLTHVLVEEGDLWSHLVAIEDLYLMRRGDAMTTFIDVLFARMDTSHPWNDFHFLNSAFADVAAYRKWIDSSLVRFSHRGSRDISIHRSVRALDGLQIEYAVPFPLTYIWGPKALQSYSAMFVFVLQIRRAKSALERILVRNPLPDNTRRMNAELKMFYAMRGKLSWFINVLLNFVCTNVLHTEVLLFHKLFKEAQSLDEMIQIHNDHLNEMESRCFLQPSTAALHRAIISILDMTLHFSDSFVSFAGDTTHDISRQFVVPMKSHRSRRLRRQRRNVIGFSQAVSAIAESSSESESDEEEDLSAATEPSFSIGEASNSLDDYEVRLDTMSSELDAVVRFIRRGVEALAGGTGKAAATFGILAFTLEDWNS